VISVERLYDDRIADGLQSSLELFLVPDTEPFGHRHAHIAKQLFCSMLVRRDIDRDHVRIRRRRRLDPLLMNTVTELDQGLIIQANERNVTCLGFLDQRTSRRPEPDLFADLAHPLDVICDRLLDLIKVFSFG
jgi:hypothetical protein